MPFNLRKIRKNWLNNLNDPGRTGLLRSDNVLRSDRVCGRSVFAVGPAYFKSVPWTCGLTKKPTGPTECFPQIPLAVL